MKSDLPKVLIPLKNKPMIACLLSAIKSSRVDNKPVIVVGYKKEEVIREFGDNYTYVVQHEQLGTAHALLSAKDACENAKKIAVFYGDHPFVSTQTIKKLLEKNERSDAEITLATTLVPNFENEYKVFSNFARILRNGEKVRDIREYKDADETEKNIKEVNPGYYVFDATWLWKNLDKIKNENSQGEYYLTDLIHIASKNGDKIESINIPPREAMGANTKEELDILEKMVL